MNTIISFSGGRTSGMMLHHILQQHGGRLPENIRVCFANTGKEHSATLDFVQACAENWRVEIVWLEWRDAQAASDRWQITDHTRAARHGEPFAGLIRQKGYLPTPVMRFCTQELKIRPIKYYARQVLGWTDWQVAIGIRADEPRRLAKLRANRDGFARYAPLAEAGITAADVGRFWQAQPFDLGLPNHNGITAHGNCDLCFLKAASKRASLIAEQPSRADWWAQQEIECGQPFRRDTPDYATLKHIAIKQIPLFEQGDFGDCFCTD